MGFAVPGIALTHLTVRPTTNWQKRRKTSKDDAGKLVQPPSLSALPYNFQRAVVPRRTYDFNRLYRHGLDFRRGRRLALATRNQEHLRSMDVEGEVEERPEEVAKESQSMPIAPRDPPKRFTLSSLPTEILIRIVALSQNIDSVRYTDTFFLKFVEEHEDNLFRALVDHYYVYRMNSAVSLDTSFKSNRLTDAEHKENSLSLSIEAMQRGARKRRYSGEYQLKDSIVVIDCEAFNQPYIKHRIMRRLHVDAVLTSSEIASLKEEVKTSLAKLKADLENSYEETLIGSERLVKGVLLNSYMEKSRIPFPFLDHRNPSNLDYLRAGDYADKLRIIRDIMHLNPIFEGDVESMLRFLIEINDRVQQDHAAASTPGDEYVGKDADNRLRLQEVKQLLVRQLKKEANTTTTTPSFTNGDLIISILTKTSKRWIRYLLQFVSPASLEEDQYFWGRIMQSKRLDYIRSLEKYSKLSPGPQVLSVLAKSSQ